MNDRSSDGELWAMMVALMAHDLELTMVRAHDGVRGMMVAYMANDGDFFADDCALKQTILICCCRIMLNR